MGGGGHLSGSNAHCVSPTHPNLCMSDVWGKTADRTNCLKHVKRQMFKVWVGAALKIRREHVNASSKDLAASARCCGNLLLFRSTKSVMEKRALV